MSAENADRPAGGGAPVGVPAALPPLTGSKLALGTIALSLATFMNVLDTSIANVSIPAIAGHLGDHLLWRGQRDFPSPDRLADAPLRAGEAVHRLGAAVRHRLLPVRAR